MTDRLCISTLDPHMGGGVPTMCRRVYDVAEQNGYDPYVVCNRNGRESDVRLQDVARGDWERSLTHTEYDGMETVFVPRVLPEFEFFQYVLNEELWADALDGADAYFGVGGDAQCCYPFVRHGLDFSCWLATLLWDDREDRLGSESLAWRVRDRLSRPFLEQIEARVLDEATSTLVLSEYTADRMRTEYGDLVDPQVVPYPIDTGTFTPDGDRRETDDDTILFVGRYNDPRKNTEVLLRAFRRVRAAVDDVRLRLVGADPATRLVDLADELGVREDVEFVEYVPHERLPAQYRSASVFVIPSEQEGLAIVGLEAMASGTPVVSTRCGGPEQYVRDGETGRLVDVDDPASMAEAICGLLTDDSTETYGRRARRQITAEYSLEELSSAFLAEFDRLTAEADGDSTEVRP